MSDARLRRDIGWNLVPVVLLGGVGLGLNFLIGGWWGAAALGTFNLVTTAFFAFAVVGALGLQYSVLRAIASAADGASEPERRERVAAIVVGALVPNVVLAAAMTAAFLALAGPIGVLLAKPSVAAGIAWAAPGLFCFAVNKVLLGIVNGLRRMRAFAVYTSLRYLLIAGGLVIARTCTLEAEQLPVIWTFTEGVLLLVLIGELVTHVSLWRARGWVAHARAHLDYGARGVLATLAYEVNSKLDVWMLGIALDETAVGIYSLAAALNEGVMQLAVVLQNNLNPVLARAAAANDTPAIEELARRTRKWFVPAIIGIAVVAAAGYPLVVPWLIGNHDFIGGAVPFAIMMAGLALASPYLPFSQLLLMAGRPGWHTALVLGQIAVSFTGLVVLIPRIGLPGAATALASSVVAAALLLRVLARSRAGVRL